METKILWFVIPAMLVFGPLFWITIFLQTYRHFPKMESRQRLMMCLTSATIMTLMLLIAVFIGFYFIAQQLVRP